MWIDVIEFMDRFGIVVQFFILLVTGINLVMSYQMSEDIEDLEEELNGE